MQCKEMNTTSPLRQERNIIGKKSPLFPRTHTGIEKLFLESIADRAYTAATVENLMDNLYGFFRFLLENAVFTPEQIRREHIGQYAAMITALYPDRCRLDAFLNVNNLVNALKVFGDALYCAHVIPCNYADALEYIQIPKEGLKL
jgi:hypothetical protein